MKDAQASLPQACVLCSGAGMEGALEAAVGGLSPEPSLVAGCLVVMVLAGAAPEEKLF